MKIAATVILYYPDEQLEQRLSTYLPLVNKLYVVDNSEVTKLTAINNEETEFNKVEIFADNANRGISERLNFACKKAIKDGFDWLLTMDQDSSFEASIIHQYFAEIEAFEGAQGVAMFGITYLKNQTIGLMPARFQEVNALITSGSIINLNLFGEIGGFDERLFIDEVDLEYCLRSIEKGYKIIQFPGIFLNHQLGIVNQYKSLANFRQSSRTLHSPVRLYYMVRNYLYVKAKYNEQFPQELTRSRKALLNRIKNNLIYSSKKRLVMKFLLKGIVDYHRHRMGKLIN